MPYPSRILLIEAEPSLRHTLAMILQQAGYTVTAPGHDQDTSHGADAQAYDLIFLDLDRVEPGTTDLLQTIRRLSPDVPTLILVASPANGRTNTVSPIERRAYLVKPIDPARVLACIRDLLDRSRATAA